MWKILIVLYVFYIIKLNMFLFEYIDLKIFKYDSTLIKRNSKNTSFISITDMKWHFFSFARTNSCIMIHYLIYKRMRVVELWRFRCIHIRKGLFFLCSRAWLIIYHFIKVSVWSNVEVLCLYVYQDNKQNH